jgi:crooked neck
LLREAKERQEQPKPPPKQRIADKEELLDYQLGKRKEFEDAVRRNRTAIGAWIKYALWEEQQDEMERYCFFYRSLLDTN